MPTLITRPTIVEEPIIRLHRIMKRSMAFVIGIAPSLVGLVELLHQWALLFEYFLACIPMDGYLLEPLIERFPVLDLDVIDRVGFVDTYALHFTNEGDYA